MKTLDIQLQNVTEKIEGLDIQKTPFEERKELFREYCSLFLDKVYEEGREEEPFYIYQHNRLYQTLQHLKGGESSRLSQEEAELVKIFVDETLQQSKDIFFQDDFFPQKDKSFHAYMSRSFFSSSPDVLEGLKYDFFDYIVRQGTIRSVGLNDYMLQGGAGEITLSAGWIEKEDFIERFHTLDFAQKIAVVKTLSHAARWAIGNSSWAYDAYIVLRNLIETLQEQSNSPLFDFVLKSQILSIQIYNKMSEGYSFTEEESNYFTSQKKLYADIYKDDMEYSQYYTIKQRESIFHENLRIKRVAKDYLALVNGIETSVSLLENPSQEYEKLDDPLYMEIIDYIDKHTYGERDIPQAIEEKSSAVERAFHRFIEKKKKEALFYIHRGDVEAQERYQKVYHRLIDISMHFSNFVTFAKQYFGGRVEAKLIPYDTLMKDKQRLVATLHTPEIIAFLNQELGIQLEEMYLDEQVQFLDYLAGVKNEQWRHLESVLKNSDLQSEDVLRSFLSLDKGGKEMGQKILDIGEKLPAESANAIFAKYAELVEATKGIEDFMRKEFSEEIAENPEVVDQVKEKLLNKGVALLNLFHERLDAFDENTKPNAAEIVEQELAKISADTIATLATFKFARKNGFDLSLEDIRNAEFRKRNAEEISKDELQEMVEIYRENYADNPVLADALVSKFKESFQGEDNEVYLYRIGGKIHAFVRFEKIGEGRKYASALNVRNEAKGYSLGEAMMEQALKAEAQEHVLFAEANLDAWNTARYFEIGFIATEKNTHYGAVPVVNIIWDEKLNEELISKKLTRDEILFGDNHEHDGVQIERYKRMSDFDRNRLEEVYITRAMFDEKSREYILVMEKKKK